MPGTSAVRSGLHLVIDRFPGEEALARKLFGTHPAFRSACEDYRLARQGLATFEARAAHPPRPELDEYRVLVRDLETELLTMCRAADGTPGQPGATPGPASSGDA